MNTGMKVAIGVGIAVVVIGGIYIASQPSAPVDAAGNPIGSPDSLAGQNLPTGGANNTQVIANGITNVLARGITEAGASFRNYNDNVTAIRRDAQAQAAQNAAAGGSTGAAQVAARQQKLNGARA